MVANPFSSMSLNDLKAFINDTQQQLTQIGSLTTYEARYGTSTKPALPMPVGGNGVQWQFDKSGQPVGLISGSYVDQLNIRNYKIAIDDWSNKMVQQYSSLTGGLNLKLQQAQLEFQGRGVQQQITAAQQAAADQTALLQQQLNAKISEQNLAQQQAVDMATQQNNLLQLKADQAMSNISLARKLQYINLAKEAGSQQAKGAASGISVESSTQQQLLAQLMSEGSTQIEFTFQQGMQQIQQIQAQANINLFGTQESQQMTNLQVQNEQQQQAAQAAIIQNQTAAKIAGLQLSTTSILGS